MIILNVERNFFRPNDRVYRLSHLRQKTTDLIRKTSLCVCVCVNIRMTCVHFLYDVVITTLHGGRSLVARKPCGAEPSIPGSAIKKKQKKKTNKL